MAEGAAGASRGADLSLRAVAVSVVAPTTWLALIHLLAGLIIGLPVFVAIAVGLAVGAALVPVLGIGVAVLMSTFWLAGQLARAERARYALLLDEHIEPPPPREQGARGWGLIRATVTRSAPWKNVAYALVRLPMSILEVPLAIIWWSSGLALVALPGYGSALPGGAAHIGSLRLGGFWWLSLAAFTGAVLLLAAPVLTRALAMADAAAGRWLLGSAAGRAELAARIGELETSRARVMDSAQAERLRIERDLHDGAQQRLVSLALELGRAKAKFASDPQAAALIVDQAHAQAKAALAELRSLVRGVHPPVLTDRGLDAALSGLAALCPVPVRVRVDLAARPPAPVEAIAYFVVAEALTNVAKHSGANAVEVTVDDSGGMLTVRILDNGAGGADPDGRGLAGLAARVAGVDGRFVVTSPAGGPTSVEAVLPCGL